MSRTGKSVAAIAALAACAAVVAFTLAPAGHAAPATFNCDASALRVTLLGAATIEPITANQGQARCQNATGTLLQTPGGLPVPLRASVGTALTQVAPDATNAQAIGGLAQLGAGLPGPVQAVLAQAVAAAQAGAQPAINAIAPITVPIGSNPLLPGVTSVTVDIRPALNALLSAIGSVNTDVVDLNLATAYAQARCVNGAPQLSGAAQLAGLSVFGIPIPTDAAATQALNVINTQSINASNIDLSKIVISPAISNPALLTVVQDALKPLLAAIPPISIPAQLAQVTVTPKEQVLANGQLTERALHVVVGLLGQQLIDGVFGEARVSNASVTCAPQPTASQLALQCTKRKLVLIDVLQHGNHVALLGAADKKLIGQRVSIYYLVGHRKVATALVGANGLFNARAPLPPRRQRFTNLARYQAQDSAGERSLDLKLHRRMVVDHIKVAGGKVTIAGRVIRPLAKPVAPISVQRRVSCSSEKTLKRIMPKRDGSFIVTLDAPPNTQAAVYRAATMVRKVVTNNKRFPTFTLPREVELATGSASTPG